jgi:hypothetical protein
MLRNSQIGAYVYPVVPSEFTNWRDEQRAWRDSAVLFDQSHHMAELTIKGPDALKLCAYTTINSFANFPVNRAKQMVPTSYEGHVIGDGILFHLDKDELLFVGRAPTVNWLQFHAETGGFKVDFIRDDRSPSHPRGKAVTRRHYRFQIQGPNAKQILDKINGGRSRREVLHDGRHQHQGPQGALPAPRHGRRAGPRDLGPVRTRATRSASTSSKAGASSDIVPVGSRAYASNTLESGWIPSPLPGVYTGEAMKKYREWLPANGYEATGSIAGQLRQRQHRGLLRQSVRARLRPVREVRPRLHRRRRAQEDRRQAASQEGDVRVAPDDMAKIYARCSSRARTTTSSSTCRMPTTPRRRSTRSSRTARRSASRCSAATATTNAPRCHSASSSRAWRSARN